MQPQRARFRCYGAGKKNLTGVAVPLRGVENFMAVRRKARAQNLARTESELPEMRARRLRRPERQPGKHQHSHNCRRDEKSSRERAPPGRLDRLALGTFRL